MVAVKRGRKCKFKEKVSLALNNQKKRDEILSQTKRPIEHGYSLGIRSDVKRAVNRFKWFVGKLGYDIDKQPPTDQYLLTKFVRALTVGIIPYKGRVPNIRQIRQELNYVSHYIQHEYEVERNKYDYYQALFESKALLFEAKVMAGYANELQRFGINEVRKIIQKYLNDSILDGVGNWDKTVYSVFVLLLYAGSGARNGDIALAKGYEETDKYVKLKDVELKCNGDLSLENLMMKVKCPYTKGNKYKENESFNVYFTSLSKYGELSVISFFLAHSLRQGLIKDVNRIEDILPAIKNNNLNQLLWKNPELPLVN